MKRYTITVQNGNYPLICKCSSISDAYGCMQSLSEGLIKDRGIDLNGVMRTLVEMEKGDTLKTETSYFGIEAEEVNT